jgi:hypothetical protein
MGSVRDRKKTLIPTFSRKREKEQGSAPLLPLPLAGEGRAPLNPLPLAGEGRAPLNPLPLAGEGRVRVFFFSSFSLPIASLPA